MAPGRPHPRIGSLCSGYEGLGMAVTQVLGGSLAWTADNDMGSSAVLTRFSGVPNLGDISAADWTAVERPHIVTAGFPCLPAGTLVDAGEDGFRAIETLRAGDLVLTHNRRRRPVTSVMRRQADDVLLVKAMGSPAFRVTAEHPFYVRRLSARQAHRERIREWSAPEWVQAGQLGKDCFLGMPLDAAVDVPVLGADLAYVVGRWLSDGWIIDHPRRNRTASRAMRVIICCVAEVAAPGGFCLVTTAPHR